MHPMRIHNKHHVFMHTGWLDVSDTMVQDRWTIKPSCCIFDHSISPIYAGTVVNISEEDDIFTILINHGNSYTSTYGNLHRCDVKLFDIVYTETKLGECIDDVLYFNMSNRDGYIDNIFSHNGINICSIIQAYGPNCGCHHHHCHPHHRTPIPILTTEPDGTVYDYIYNKTEMRETPSKHGVYVGDVYRGSIVSWNNRIDKIVSEGSEWILIKQYDEPFLQGYIQVKYLSSYHK